MANADLRTVFSGDFAFLEPKNEATLRAYSMQGFMSGPVAGSTNTRDGLNESAA